MEQRYIVKNLVNQPHVEEFTQKLRLIESRLFWGIVYCMKTGNQKRAHMLAREILYVRNIKESLKIK